MFSKKPRTVTIFKSLATPIVALSFLAPFSATASSLDADTSKLYSYEQLSQSFAPCAYIFPDRSGEIVKRNFDAKSWRTAELCSDNFAVLYSKRSKTPLVVVERLNASILQDAKDEERTDIFYPDPRLKREDRADLSDYKGSGFDRGHQAPAADSPTSRAMAQTFALSNMIPQDPTNNRKIWSKIESDTRKYIARTKGDVVVFTGPMFLSKTHQTIGHNDVWVPTHLFKLVWDPSANKSWAFLIPNTADAQIDVISYDEFVKRTGLNLLKPM